MASETGEVAITLLTITHPTLPAPIYISGDAVNTVSRGNTYLAFPFQITLPDENPDQPASAMLTIDAVDQAIIDAIRLISTYANILIEIVLASTPNTVEFSSGALNLRDVQYDALTVQGRLTFDDFLNEPFPGDSVTPVTIPGVFSVAGSP